MKANNIDKYSLCEFSKYCGHKEIWRPLAANNLAETSPILWPLASTNNKFPSAARDL